MPIALSKKEWDRIVKWTDPNKEDPVKARRREYVKALTEASKKMAKEWPNSLENVNKRNEAERLARIAESEQANHVFYQKYLKNRNEEQQRMMYSARDTFFKDKDAPKQMLGGVIESAVQGERDLQLKFKRAAEEKRAAQKKAEDEATLRQAREWNEMQRAKKQKRRDVMKQHVTDMLAEAEAVAEQRRREFEEEMRLQMIDNERSKQQLKAIEQFELFGKKSMQGQTLRDLIQSREDHEKKRRETESRDKMEDQMIEVLNRSKARVNQKRQQTENETHQARLRVIENISNKLSAQDTAKEKVLQENHERAFRKLQADMDARDAAERAHKQNLRQERIALRKQYLEEEKKIAGHMAAKRAWDMANRCKNEELYAEFLEQLKLKKLQRQQLTKEILNAMIKECKDRKAAEEAERRYYYGELAEKKLRNADNKLLLYAEELIAEAIREGRPTLPIQKAIHSHCKRYNLYPQRDIPESLKPHFQNKYHPRDMSKADPWYKIPPKPTVQPLHDDDDKPEKLLPAKLKEHEERQPDPQGRVVKSKSKEGLKKSDSKEKGPKVEKREEVKKEMDRRDGLQPFVPGTAVQTEETALAPSSAVAPDFTRRGPANGLQQRPECRCPAEFTIVQVECPYVNQ